MFAEPSNDTPPIVLAVASVVAVSALPVTSPVKLPVKIPAIAPVPVIVGEVKVLFVSVSVLEAVIYPAPLVNALLFVGISLVNAIVPVDVGNVKVPVFEIVEMTGDVKVLFVNV